MISKVESQTYRIYLEKNKHLRDPEYILDPLTHTDCIAWILEPEFFAFVTEHIEEIELGVDGVAYSSLGTKIKHEFLLTVDKTSTNIFKGFFIDSFDMFSPYLETNNLELATYCKMSFT